MRIDGCEGDGGHDVNERPCPEVVQEWEEDRGVFEHVEGREEVGDVEVPTGNHVVAEGEEHLQVGAFVGAVLEEVWITREERFGEEKQGDEEGERGAQCAEVVVPLPTCLLA